MLHQSSSPPSLPVAIGDVLKQAAAEVVMPLFGKLKDRDIEEKFPGELVTKADRDAEQIIAEGLTALCPFARFVGEEACAKNPSLLDDIANGDVWIVDPIDGTGNYAAGRKPFALMAALLRGGEAVAASILDPVGGSITLAEKGRGAWIDGERIVSPDDGRDLTSLKGIISNFERPQGVEPNISRLSETVAEVMPTRRCAGAEYPMIANGHCDFAIYWRTLVWDHAPGILILEEAGGKAARIDGTPFKAGDDRGGVILAHSHQKWDQVAAILA